MRDLDALLNSLVNIEAVERYARIERILSFFQHGGVAPEMSERDVTLCKSLEERLRDRGHS